MQVSCVIKLGGSLLDLPDLPQRIANYLSDFARPFPVVTCGGGATVDLIRKWDRLFHLDEVEAHWIAVRALSINALVAAQVIPALHYSQSHEEFPGIWKRSRVPLYDAYEFIRNEDARALDPLPRRWRVTSDSIAARMAMHFAASELILVKSTEPEEGMRLADAARAGLVDPYFPTAARGLQRIVVVNLRDTEPRETLLLEDEL